MKSPNSVVVVRMVAVHRPSGKSDFNRWKAAIPNLAGNAFGKVDVSFDKPYAVDQSSDMVGMDEGISATFFERLTAMGFSAIRFV